MFPTTWSATTAWFTSDFVQASIPFLLASWVVGYVFGKIFRLIQTSADAWRN